MLVDDRLGHVTDALVWIVMVVLLVGYCVLHMPETFKIDLQIEYLIICL